MIGLADGKKFTCISCFDRDAHTYDIRIGAHDNNKTVITLCDNCLGDLVDEVRVMSRPPLGLRPKWIVRELRLLEINEAISRYIGANKDIPKEWWDERRELLNNKKANSE